MEVAKIAYVFFIFQGIFSCLGWQWFMFLNLDVFLYLFIYSVTSILPELNFFLFGFGFAPLQIYMEL